MGSNVVLVPKKDVLAIVDEFPDGIDVEDLIHRLYLREKLATAEAEIAAGRSFSSEELREQAASWFA